MGTLNDPAFGGRVAVTFPSGTTYVPGTKQHLVVTVSDPAQKRWGFQLTTRPESDAKTQAGSFTATDGNTQVVTSGTLQYIEHTLAGTRLNQPQSATFEFDWTPPASSVGNIVVYVAGNAANGNGEKTGDHIYSATYTLTPASAGGSKPSISQNGVVNAWNAQSTISDASWVTIFGSGFGGSGRTWRNDELVNGKLPTQLDGIGVKVNNQDAFVYFIGDNQINIQAPSDGSTGNVSVQVTTRQGTSDPIMVTKQAFAPALFTWAGVVPDGGKYAGAVTTDAQGRTVYIGKTDLLKPVNIATRPARPGETVLFFGTGFGPTSPAVPAGQVVTQPARMANPVTVTIGNQPAQVSDTGFLIFSGEYQFNVKIPDSLPDGDAAVDIAVQGVHTQSNVFITVQR